MKSVFDSSDGEISTGKVSAYWVDIMAPLFTLAVSGLLEALRYAAKAQDKLAFKISLISEFPNIPIISNAGIIMRPDSTHAPPDSFNYLAVIGGELQYLDLGYQGIKRIWHMPTMPGFRSLALALAVLSSHRKDC